MIRYCHTHDIGWYMHERDGTCVDEAVDAEYRGPELEDEFLGYIHCWTEWETGVCPHDSDSV